MILIFDTETNGLPRRWTAPVTDVDNWPRLVQIAWLACRPDGTAIDRREHIIKPEGFVISRKASQVHGITTKRARAEGVALKPVLEAFAEAVAEADLLVAHNMDFDAKIVGAELLRAGMTHRIDAKRCRCTMKESVDYCRVPSAYGYKWPTLTELHERLFGESFGGAHGALADAEACMRCFFRLCELGVMSRPS